jgi:hypothetical protein
VLTTIAALALAAGLSGCAPPASNQSSSPETSGGEQGRQAGPAEGAGQMDHSPGKATGQMEHAAADKAEKIKANLAKLSEEDRASAEAQGVCPVSGQTLGAMGPPRKVTVNGRDVWICCGGCEKALKDDPDKYLAKLKN